MKFSFLAAVVLIGTLAEAQPVLGKWKSIDDNTGKPRSIVEISENNGKVFGKIIKLFRGPEQDQDPICDKCDPADARFRKKVIGMEIIRNMAADGGEYLGGTSSTPKTEKSTGPGSGLMERT